MVWEGGERRCLLLASDFWNLGTDEEAGDLNVREKPHARNPWRDLVESPRSFD